MGQFLNVPALIRVVDPSLRWDDVADRKSRNPRTGTILRCRIRVRKSINAQHNPLTPQPLRRSRSDAAEGSGAKGARGKCRAPRSASAPTGRAIRRVSENNLRKSINAQHNPQTPQPLRRSPLGSGAKGARGECHAPAERQRAQRARDTARERKQPEKTHKRATSPATPQPLRRSRRLKRQGRPRVMAEPCFTWTAAPAEGARSRSERNSTRERSNDRFPRTRCRANPKSRTRRPACGPC